MKLRRLVLGLATVMSAIIVGTCADDPSRPSDDGVTGPSAAKTTQPPVADAGGPYSGTVGVAVAFDGTSSYDPDGPNNKLSFAWSFGDGAQSTAASPSHAYASGGVFPVTLVVTDQKGAKSQIASTTATIGTTPPPPPPPSGVVLVGAGDIASCSSSGDEATANLLDGIAGTVFTAGDNAYDNGTASEYANCYGPSWGRHRSRTLPVPGNHEYNTSGATGYYGYFGAAAGDPTKGYYSRDLGDWHIIVLNSNIARGAGSAQEQWLRADLAAHPVQCTLAIWHHPRFNSGTSHGDDTSVAAFWNALYEGGADVIINGHEHIYERFAPQTPQAVASAGGIREFIVGTGGRSHYTNLSAKPNSEVRNGTTYGVLRLTLSTGGYAWQFVPVAGATFTDSGTANCH